PGEFSAGLLTPALDRDGFSDYLQQLISLAPNGRIDVDHVLALGPEAAMAIVVVRGDAETGEYELPSIGIMEYGPDGKAVHAYFYLVEEFDDARAKYDEIVAAAH